ncbi:MAG TPA: M28 family peptidase [Bryobacteraceae bacterium]|nr:M28 family peptidase [Bryobacteraceae bacterium]
MRTTASFLLLLATAWHAGLAQTATKPELAGASAALQKITAADLKGDLSFLASDALQGRFTPSPGLEVAAEFIASRFRAAGLEPGGDTGYFQVAHMVERQLPKVATEMTVATTNKDLKIAPDAIAMTQISRSAEINNAAVVSFSTPDVNALSKTDISGKVVLTVVPDLRKLPEQQAMADYRRLRPFLRAVEASRAVVGIAVSSSLMGAPGSRLLSADDAQQTRTPIVNVANAELLEMLEKPESAAQIKTVSIHLPAPRDEAVNVNNVIGVLRGSDPRLRDTAVLLTAHYDHIGTLDTARGMASPPKPNERGDRIYNGANDDGSGTVSVIAIAEALSRLRTHPKRSIVFMTFFGEERGELGSQFYGEHPVFPIAQTVADINLEQVGRTDSTNGKQVNTASLTGYDYSDITTYLEQAGRQTGIKLYKDPQASDAYFTRSDNDALAEQGIPAHTLTVAFDYPDYHGLADTWDKVDYENMARVDRMIGLALINLADARIPPKWNTANPKTKPFLAAQKKNAP